MEVDILPHKYTGAAYLRGAQAVEGKTDLRGLGTLTTIEMLTAVEFRCKWDWYVCNSGLIIVYFEFPNQTSFLVVAADEFPERITVV